MISIYLKRIEELSEKEKQNIISSLSESARSRLTAKNSSHLALSSLSALSLLSCEQRADLEYGKDGRPFFRTLGADISISHSESYAAVAISSDKAESVGIDIEDISKENKGLARFFTKAERASLENGSSAVEIWTKKEALFKFLKNDPTPFIQLDSTASEMRSSHFITTRIENSILTVCAPPDSQIRIIQK